MKQTPWSFILVTVLVTAGGCASSEPAADPATWGHEALEYFETWAAAYSENDRYGVLDFYALDATVEERTSDFRDTAPPVATVLGGNTAQLTRTMLDLHVGVEQAIALVVWPDYTIEHGVVLMDLAGGYIGSETILFDAASLQRSLRADPTTITRYTALSEELAGAWTSGDSGKLTALYAPDATIRNVLTGLEVTGHAAIGKLATQGSQGWATTRIPVPTGSNAAGDAALFLDPIEYGSDPQRAVGVVEITGDSDCTIQTAVYWLLEGDVIVEEYRYPEVESFRQCAADSLVEGWWTGLAPPGPRDQVETGVLVTPNGNSISVRNGTPRLESLIEWALAQYAEAGLPEPLVDTVTFEPTRQCAGVAGRVIAAGADRDLVLCMYETELGRESSQEADFALRARVGMLHELAHAWMLEEVDESTRDQVLELSGRRQWTDDQAPWQDRGVEYAAQVMAWGLADEPVQLVELGRPPCTESTAVFESLTGTAPLAPGCTP